MDLQLKLIRYLFLLLFTALRFNHIECTKNLCLKWSHFIDIHIAHQNNRITGRQMTRKLQI